jgi:predicted dehydrogenase
MASSVEECEELCSLAERCGLVLMVDHTFLYTSAVQKIKELVTSDVTGQLLYFDSVRVNLGLVQPHHNVVWDLAPHDLSILLYLLRERPMAVSAIGACHVKHTDKALATMAYLTLKMRSGVLAHIHVNWLSPVKVRRTLIAGTKRMIVYDDLEPDEKVKVYDKGVLS